MEYLLPNNKGSITHPALVTALVKPGEDILASLTAQKADAWHMASCIPGEAGELFQPLRHAVNGAALDRSNVVEELGDLEFYMQGLRAAVGLERSTLSDIYNPLGDAFSFLALPGRAADVFDAVKKWVIYNKPIDLDAIDDALLRLDLILSTIRQVYDIDRNEVLATNVMKLGARYEGLSYSDSAAQRRADKTIH